MNTTQLSTTAAHRLAPGALDIAKDVLARLEAAWDAGDGEAFGAPYADDATFVTVRGEQVRGRGGIAGGHAGILASIYAGSTNHMDVVDARFVADDVIVATSRNTMVAPTGPLAGTNTAMSTSVLVRDGSQWRIAATQNTLEAGH